MAAVLKRVPSADRGRQSRAGGLYSNRLFDLYFSIAWSHAPRSNRTNLPVFMKGRILRFMSFVTVRMLHLKWQAISRFVFQFLPAPWLSSVVLSFINPVFVFRRFVVPPIIWSRCVRRFHSPVGLEILDYPHAPFEILSLAHSGAFKKKVHSAKSVENKRAQVTRIEFHVAEGSGLSPEDAQLGQATKRHYLQVGSPQVADEKPKWPRFVKRPKETAHLRNLVEFARFALEAEDAKNELVQITSGRDALTQFVEGPSLQETGKITRLDFLEAKYANDWGHRLLSFHKSITLAMACS